jgi:uncharacterized protein (DUF697 family)
MSDTPETRRHEASTIIKTYMGWSAGAAFLPVPYVDLAAVTAVQVKMVADLAAVYNVPFSRNVVKSIIGGLLGSVLPATLAQGLSSLIKAIPGVGSFLGAITGPGFATASTYALGRIFVQHFEAGGNVLNFDPEAMREHFKHEFDQAVANGKAGKAAA